MSLDDVVRRAVELYLKRFPNLGEDSSSWVFPTIDSGRDYRIDPACVDPEAEAATKKGK